MGEIGLILPSYWSPDSRHIYFHAFTVGPCCMDGVPDWGEFVMSYFPLTLYRMDASNGVWARFVSYENYSSLSPTGRRLVSIQRTGREPGETPRIILTLFDLQTGAESRFILEDRLAAGYVVWSEDGRKLVFSTVRQEIPDGRLYDYELVLIDSETHTLRMLTSFDPAIDGIIFPVEWTNEIIRVKMISFSPQDTRYQQVDLDALQTTPTSFTP